MTFDPRCTAYDPILSAHIDGDLTAAEEIDLSVHLAGCDRCQAQLEGYRRVTNRAAGLEDRPVPRDLWAGIAERIGATVPAAQPVARSGFRRTMTRYRVPQLLAAGLVALTVTAGVRALWSGPSAPEMTLDTPVVSDLAMVQNDTGYERAIGDLIGMFEELKPGLDLRTIEVIENNLAVMDLALARANAALVSDPESRFLRRHLVRTSRQKLELLQRVTTLTSAD